MDDVKLGEKIRIARTMRGLSQEELAAAIGKDQKAVSKYELGQRRLFASDIPKLANTLDVPVWFFFEDTMVSTELDNEILRQVHNMPNNRARMAALDLLRLLSKTLQDQLKE